MNLVAIHQETWTFLYACLLGMGLTACYDVLRLWRILIPHRALVVSLEDLLFFIAAAVVTYGFLLTFQKGDFRMHLLIGQMAGATLYFWTASRLVHWILTPIVKILKSIFRMIFYPIKAIFGCLKKIFSKYLQIVKEKKRKISKKFSQIAKIHLKKRHGMVYNDTQ